MKTFKKIPILIIVSVICVLSGCREEKYSKTILLVSGWQDVNIGDIAHTPGMLHVLNTFIPDANIIVWKKSSSERVDELLYKHFPNVKIINGEVNEYGDPDNEEIYEAFEKADIMIHGSGPYIVGQPHLEAWVKHAGEKPFGIFGVTVEKIDEKLKELLSKASFIYTRETQSLHLLESIGISGDNIMFAPDVVFYLNIRDDEKVLHSLNRHGLETGKFICVVPRLRITPYYNIANRHLWSEKRIEQVENHNNRYKEEDHAKLREAIVEFVRATGNKVLICPEMTYQVDIMDELLFDPLPEDVKPYVIKQDYWMPDEAASVYAQAFAVLSFDCHSPIMAFANNTPFLYLRQPEDTSKGQMYYDLNFADWIFEIEETTGEEITGRLFEIKNNYEQSKEKIKQEEKAIEEIYQNVCRRIEEIVYKGGV